MSPRKQTRFFAFDVEDPGFRGPAPENLQRPYAITDLQSYHALFDGVTTETAVGEASWTYLYRSEAPRRIQEHAPDAKFIVILRNPADRAYSHYRQNVEARRESVADFAQALEQEGARIRDNWWPEFHYVQMGLYCAQLKRYFDAFERDQIKVFLYDDLSANPYGLLRDTFRFLNVDDTFAPKAIIRSNPTGVPKSKHLRTFLRRLEVTRPAVERFVGSERFISILRLGTTLNNRNITQLRLSPEERREVIDRYFRQDVVDLQFLIRRDLSAWLGTDRQN